MASISLAYACGVWTSTNDDYGLNYGLALARKAQASGMKIMFDLHYSDTRMSFLGCSKPYLTRIA